MFHPAIEALTDTDFDALHGELIARGFVRLEPFVTRHTADRLMSEMETLAHRHGPSSPYFVLRDGADVILMNRLDRESDFLFDFARHPTFARVTERLLGLPAISLHTEYFAKWPLGMRPTPPHQDQVFYQAHFADTLAISCWIALDDVSEESGALEYAASPSLTLLPHIPSQTLDFDSELADASGLTFVPVPVERGGCIVHHSYAVHRAGVNRTAHPRRAVAFNYRGSPYRASLRGETDRDVGGAQCSSGTM